MSVIAKRELLAQALDRSGCNRLLRRAGVWNGLLVLNYHRIGEPQNSLFEHGLWSATAEEFERQVKHLARNFEVVGLSDLPNLAASREQNSRRRLVMMTFDDGYRDNFEVAFPILRSRGVPAVFFLTTGFLDRPRVAWWDEIAWMVHTSGKLGLPANPWTISPVPFGAVDRQPAIERLLKTYKLLSGQETEPYLAYLAEETGSGRCPESLGRDLWMTWDMAREMRNAGMNFGAHTVNHPILANLSAEEQGWEICESKLRLEQELGDEITALSYPVGSTAAFSSITRRCLERHGVRFGFSYYGGYNRLDQFDSLDIRRVAVETDVSRPAFRAVTALPQVFA